MIYLLKGSDDYSKSKELEKLIRENTDEDFAVFDLEETFGENVTYDRVINGASIVPVGSRKRVFLVRFAHKIPKEDQKIIAQNIDRINKDGVLIFHTPAPLVKDGKVSPGSEVIPELEKAVKKSKNGEVKDFSLVTKKKDIASKVIPFAAKLFTDRGKKITPSAVSLFVDRVGTNYVLLDTEAEKVLAYALDEPQITDDIIKKVTSPTSEEKIFDFLDYVANRQTAKAVKGAEDLFTEGNDPRAVSLKTVTLLRSQVTQIWQGIILIKLKPSETGKMLVSSFVANGIKKEDIDEKDQKYFPGNSLLSKAGWQQAKILRIAKKTTFLNLAKWIFYLEEADSALKNYEGSSEEPLDVMKMLAYKISR